MTLADDIANDHEYIDGVEDVTFTPRTPDATAITSVKALREPITRKHAIYGTAVDISPTDTVFNLWVSSMGVTPPNVNPHDKITDATNVEWLVIAAQKKTLGTRWECICRKFQS